MMVEKRTNSRMYTGNSVRGTAESQISVGNQCHFGECTSFSLIAQFFLPISVVNMIKALKLLTRKRRVASIAMLAVICSSIKAVTPMLQMCFENILSCKTAKVPHDCLYE